jgi:hypothetical protein
MPKMITNFRKKGPLREQGTHVFLSLLGHPSSISSFGSHSSLISSVPFIPALNFSVGSPSFLISPQSSSSLFLCSSMGFPSPSFSLLGYLFSLHSSVVFFSSLVSSF